MVAKPNLLHKNALPFQPTGYKKENAPFSRPNYVIYNVDSTSYPPPTHDTKSNCSGSVTDEGPLQPNRSPTIDQG